MSPAALKALFDADLIAVTMSIDARPRGTLGEWTPLAGTVEPITFDETTIPAVKARIALAGPAPQALLDPTRELWQIRLTVNLTHGETTTSTQIAVMIVTGVESLGGRTTLVCESDEVLLSGAVISPSAAETACPQRNSLGQIWEVVRTKITGFADVEILDETTIPAWRQDEVWATAYGPGDDPLAYLRSLADLAGLWLHSNQAPGSPGGLIVERRPLPLGSALDVDLRANHPESLVLTSSTRTSLGPDWGSSILLTCSWTDDAGQRQTSSGLIRSDLADQLTPRVQDIKLPVRPPVGQRTRITSAWVSAQALADRVARRTWELKVTTPLLPWLRCGQTALTDQGEGIITSIRADPALVSQTLTIRPA